MIIPYIGVKTTVLAGNGTGSAVLNVSAGQTFRLRRLSQTSTGLFNVTAIRNRKNAAYGNMGASNPLSSKFIKNAVDAYPVGPIFEPPLETNGNDDLIIDLIDTSGSSNTVSLMFEGELEF